MLGARNENSQRIYIALWPHHVLYTHIHILACTKRPVAAAPDSGINGLLLFLPAATAWEAPARCCLYLSSQKSFHVSPFRRSLYETKTEIWAGFESLVFMNFLYLLFLIVWRGKRKYKGQHWSCKINFQVFEFASLCLYYKDINISQHDLYKMTLYPAHTSDRAFFQRQGRPQKSQQEAKILCQPPPSYPSSPTSIPTYSYVGLEYVLLPVPAIAPS